MENRTEEQKISLSQLAGNNKFKESFTSIFIAHNPNATFQPIKIITYKYKDDNSGATERTAFEIPYQLRFSNLYDDYTKQPISQNFQTNDRLIKNTVRADTKYNSGVIGEYRINNEIKKFERVFVDKGGMVTISDLPRVNGNPNKIISGQDKVDVIENMSVEELEAYLRLKKIGETKRNNKIIDSNEVAYNPTTDENTVVVSEPKKSKGRPKKI